MIINITMRKNMYQETFYRFFFEMHITSLLSTSCKLMYFSVFVILGDSCKMVPFWRQMQMQMYFFITHLVVLTGKSSSKHFSYRKLLSLQSSLPSLFCLIRTVPTLSLFSSKPTGPCTTKNTKFYLKCTGIFKKN